METHTRTIIKSLTWRIGGLGMTFATAWAITGRPALAASIGVVDTAIKLVAFYAHERLWLKIGFGLRHPPDYEI